MCQVCEYRPHATCQTRILSFGTRLGKVVLPMRRLSKHHSGMYLCEHHPDDIQPNQNVRVVLSSNETQMEADILRPIVSKSASCEIIFLMRRYCLHVRSESSNERIESPDLLYLHSVLTRPIVAARQRLDLQWFP